VKSEKPQFEVQTYVGSDIAQLEDGERPPRSAKLVVDLDMGSHPGGGDYRAYLLSTNRECSAWILWLRFKDWNDKPLYCRIATGRSHRGCEARFAAEQLLLRSWQDERDQEGQEPPPWVLVLEAGLLTEEDIDRLKLTVFGEEPSA
jgi:hypothetical protein